MYIKALNWKNSCHLSTVRLKLSTCLHGHAYIHACYSLQELKKIVFNWSKRNNNHRIQR